LLGTRMRGGRALLLGLSDFLAIVSSIATRRIGVNVTSVF
jgi:hypothetical protein